MICCNEDSSFKHILNCLNMLEGIKELGLLMLFKKYQSKTPFNRDKVKHDNKMSNCENLVLYVS